MPKARANSESRRSSPVSNMKVEKVVNAPMKPTSTTALASPEITSLSSASDQTKPKRKVPEMFTANVPQGKAPP